ncbi:hypothetical protein [Rheinheimera sp. MMS21-TC3]|uniref:hypothetical protein n=1 Tax=Rheinheimera sp. MMS21-TC3 TaxID=3072790 RepID=UPI0028C4D7F4|nr:hypothetical protein [Rheinheimera sp. MMS21-TC3]WNO60856.1 hypothetical protein RDV63_07805 [Rheinheimera sp. MMS21-TC3]
MTAALKMAAPGELSYQLKKLMVFCAEPARSIKAMRHHLAVTESVIQDLLNQALAQKLIWRQSNGMYKTVGTKLAFIQAEQAPAESSLLALASTPTPVEGSVFTATPSESVELDVDVIDIDDCLQEADCAQPNILRVSCPIENSLARLNRIFAPDQLPEIDNIDDKQRALSGIALMIKPHDEFFASVLNELSADLSVIRLHQERRV